MATTTQTKITFSPYTKDDYLGGGGGFCSIYLNGETVGDINCRRADDGALTFTFQMQVLSDLGLMNGYDRLTVQAGGHAKGLKRAKRMARRELI